MPTDNRVLDPIKFLAWGWPDVVLADYQERIVYSVRDNDDTFVPAGNKLGKDFISAFIILWFFMSRSPVRIVTTSAKDDHLDVIWGEMKRFINTCKYPLVHPRGPLIVNQRQVSKYANGRIEELSYVKGMVAAEDTNVSLQGHHIARVWPEVPMTLFVCDEASGVRDDYWKMLTWAHRKLIIGNPWPCHNFFYHAVKGRPGSEDKGGDILSPDGERYYRRIIRVKAEDSPNVRLAQREIALGFKATNRELVPGVKSWDEYIKDRMTMNAHEQCVSLDADWYEGADIKLYPPDWLNRAERIALGTDEEFNARGLKIPAERTARAVGVDTAEGGDSSCWTAVDEWGIIEQMSQKTPDTSIIPGTTLAFAMKHKCSARNILFDAGGGGKQHGDALRAQGYPVRLIAFGESATSVDKFKGGIRTKGERKEEFETRYVYKNRRAEMYGTLRELLDPSLKGTFGIHPRYAELRRQLSPIPLAYDNEGQLLLPPKHRKQDGTQERGEKVTMESLIGCSPDEADSLVLAVYGMLVKSSRITAGVV